MPTGSPCAACQSIPCRCSVPYNGFNACVIHPTDDERMERLHDAILAAWFVREMDDIAAHANRTGDDITDHSYDSAMEEAVYVADEGIKAYRRQK